VDRETAKQIDAIMDYMTEDRGYELRRFKKTTLPREVIELPSVQ
jgi:hypothetical protein